MNPRSAEIAAVAQVVGSVGMFGVIWMVQVVHYPLMRFVSGPEFARFETAHRIRISWVVGPLMLIEGVCVLAFFFAPPAGLSRVLPFVGGLVLMALARIVGPDGTVTEDGPPLACIPESPAPLALASAFAAARAA